jgi:hypothetical protein
LKFRVCLYAILSSANRQCFAHRARNFFRLAGQQRILLSGKFIDRGATGISMVAYFSALRTTDFLLDRIE